MINVNLEQLHKAASITKDVVKISYSGIISAVGGYTIYSSVGIKRYKDTNKYILLTKDYIKRLPVTGETSIPLTDGLRHPYPWIKNRVPQEKPEHCFILPDFEMFKRLVAKNTGNIHILNEYYSVNRSMVYYHRGWIGCDLMLDIDSLRCVLDVEELQVEVFDGKVIINENYLIKLK